MTGEKNLDKLLKSMSPSLMDGEYVFCTFPHSHYGDHTELDPLASFIESEGLTLIVAKSKADEYKLDYESVFKGIALSVHSSLEAVGLTATISHKLAYNGISANVCAAFYHDHIFVQRDYAEKALGVLTELSL